MKRVQVKTATGVKRVFGIYAYDAIGSRKRIVRGYVYDANGDRKQFYPGEVIASVGVAVGVNTAIARTLKPPKQFRTVGIATMTHTSIAPTVANLPPVGTVDARAVFARDFTKSGIGGTDSATISFFSSGTCGQNGGTAVSGTYTWLLTGAASDFEIRVASIVGQNPTAGSSAVDTWLSLGTSRSWTLQLTNADDNFDSTYQIRRVSNGSIAGSNTFSLQVATAP